MSDKPTREDYIEAAKTLAKRLGRPVYVVLVPGPAIWPPPMPPPQWCIMLERNLRMGCWKVNANGKVRECKG